MGMGLSGQGYTVMTGMVRSNNFYGMQTTVTGTRRFWVIQIECKYYHISEPCARSHTIFCHINYVTPFVQHRDDFSGQEDTPRLQKSLEV